MADETGLGKTHVAKEVIAQTVEHLRQADHLDRIDIVYVCSNADIAAQNICKLNVAGSESPSFPTRLSLLITMPEMLQPTVHEGGKPTTFVAFTPATSFQLGNQMGRKEERAVLYVLLRDYLGLQGAGATAALRIFQGGVGNWQKFRDRESLLLIYNPLRPASARHSSRNSTKVGSAGLSFRWWMRSRGAGH